MPEVIRTILTADSSQLRSEFARASAACAGYQQQQRTGFAAALAGHQAELAALRMQAAGFPALAASMRQQATLAEQAARLAVSANITERQAIAILQEKLQLQRNIAAAAGQASAAAATAAARAAAIANPRLTGLPGGGALPPLSAQSLAAMERAAAAQRELRRQTLLAGQSGRNGALGFLAFSQAVEDAQYGIKGVLNNIPQMILGFGGTAGLAGAISLAAVAAAVLYPVFKKLYGATDNENLQKAAAEFDAVFKAGMESAREFEHGVRVEREMLALSEEIHQSLSGRLQLVSNMSKYWDDELEKSKQLREMQKEILQARIELSQAKGETVTAATGGVRTLESKGVESDLINRGKEYLRVQQEIERIGKTNANITLETKTKEAAILSKIIELKKNLAGAEANFALQKTEGLQLAPTGFLDKLLSGDLKAARQKLKEVAASKERVTQIRREIDLLEKSKEVTKSAYAEEIARATGQIEELDKKANKTKEEIESLKQLIEQRKVLNKLEDQTEQEAATFKGWQTFIDQIRKENEESQKAAEENKKLLAEQKSKDSAQADFGSEIAALRLEVSGRKEMADKLREEYQLRKAASELAEETGISEQQALAALREKAGLLEKLKAKEENGGKLRGIRRYEGSVASTLGARGLSGRLGVDGSRLELGGARLGQNARNSELRRRAGERTAAQRPPADPGLKALERSVDLQEQMLGVFKKLGVI